MPFENTRLLGGERLGGTFYESLEIFLKEKGLLSMDKNSIINFPWNRIRAIIFYLSHKFALSPTRKMDYISIKGLVSP
jgi:hypothetical protein